jgi:hypothetical protein
VYLRLDTNLFSKTIPSELGDLTTLETISVYVNDLTG